MSTVRVRIAPSPSGFLHIGTAKIALMNWLYARKTGGTFVLRLEDTDADRTEEEYVQAMCEGFHWLGIAWDEGPEFGDVPQMGDHGPYRQSLRKDLHIAAAEKMLAEGKAYKCFCTKEELEAMREEAQKNKRPPLYNGTWRDASPEAVAAMGDAPYAIRFRVPEGETVVEDIVQGSVRFQNKVDHDLKEYEDFIIVKPNGAPIFHLAVVVDDMAMGITHIIRGDDHLTNAAKHVMLFKALGHTPPKMAHLPMVLDERGKKYSKREHGANVLDWRADGYLPDALINYVVLLGWTAGDDKELYTRDELIQAFSLERLGKSAAKFDLKRLQWLNGQHMRLMTPERLRDLVLPIIEKAGFDTSSKSETWLTRMAAICQEKLRTLNEITDYTDFFFQDVTAYDEKAVKKQWEKEGAVERLEAIRDAFAAAPAWESDALQTALTALAEGGEEGIGAYIHPTRLALTGKSVGPGLYELAELLGKETSLARLEQAIAHVKQLAHDRPSVS